MPETLINIPQTLNLRALNETWSILKEPCEHRAALLQRPDNTLILLGNLNEPTRSNKLFLDWLKDYAYSHLLAWLQRISTQCQLSFTQLKIRAQRSRWGSCSSDKRISLNMQLLFLPQHLVTHIMIHELCHTVYLDHSTQFWNLVAKHDANVTEHRQQLRKAHRYLPKNLF